MSEEPDTAARAEEERAARKAGWRRADLAWERAQEEGNALLGAGDAEGAAKCFRRAGWISFWRFRRADPRRATTLANLGCAERLAGNEAKARVRYAEARALWERVDGFIAGMKISRRARSSLFHMRMEAKHLETYQSNMRIRMTGFAREAAEGLAALEAGMPAPRRLYARWKGEKLPVYDDTRKLLAAALLVADPAAAAGRR